MIFMKELERKVYIVSLVKTVSKRVYTYVQQNYL